MKNLFKVSKFLVLLTPTLILILCVSVMYSIFIFTATFIEGIAEYYKTNSFTKTIKNL